MPPAINAEMVPVATTAAGPRHVPSMLEPKSVDGPPSTGVTSKEGDSAATKKLGQSAQDSLSQTGVKAGNGVKRGRGRPPGAQAAKTKIAKAKAAKSNGVKKRRTVSSDAKARKLRNASKLKRAAAKAEEEKDEGEKEYTVEAILDSKVENGTHMYQIKWKGYPHEENTWETEDNLENCPDLIKSFNEARTKKAKANKSEKSKPAPKRTAAPRTAKKT